MKENGLLVVGELNVDLILNQIKGLPELGQEKLAETIHVTLGSSSAIFAANIATLGTPTSFVGKIGADNFGELVIKELETKKVRTEHIQIDNKYQTGVTVVMNYSNDRANVTYCGAMEHLKFEDIPWGSISEYKHLHLSNYFLQKGLQKDILKIFQKAKESGLTTSLDLQVDPDENWDFDYESCLPFVDIFLPNESELLGLAGEENVDAALDKIGRFGHIIALKQSTKGSLLYTKGNQIKFTPFLHEEFVDAIGAGDSFNSGFIHQFLKGEDLETCMNYANLMGALNTTAPGGTGAFTSIEEIEMKIKETFKQTI